MGITRYVRCARVTKENSRKGELESRRHIERYGLDKGGAETLPDEATGAYQHNLD